MAAPSCFTVGLLQMACTESVDRNLRHAVEMIDEAARRGAQVICLQELVRSRYFCQEEDVANFDLAESVSGPALQALSVVAARLGVVLAAPIFECRASGVYHNSAAVIDADGRLLGLYRKMHIPDDPGYYEKFYFSPGDLGYRVFDTRFGKIAVLICWDQWYPEAARIAALGGAGIVFYPTAIGWHPREKEGNGCAQRDAWRTVQRGHAIANGVYIAAVNRIGLERIDPRAEGIEFWGSSFFCDPQGVLLAEASTDSEEILLGEVRMDRIEEVRRNWPFLRDRRIDSYGGILHRFLDEHGP
jgi:N-carbamoylputrescine amidase